MSKESIELDLFGEPVSKVPIPLAQKELAETPIPPIPQPDLSNIPELNFQPRKIASVIREYTPDGRRTTIWNEELQSPAQQS